MKQLIFPDVESVCYHTQNYIDLSKYNFKRTTNEANPKRLTFVCSCVCKKNQKDDDCISSTETSTDSVKKRSNNLKGFVKRQNVDSCSYRITFIKNENGEYFLRDKLANQHNHPPEMVSLKLILTYYILF
jgi:hypothetical protein